MPLTFYLGSEAVSIIVHFVLLYGLGFDSFHHDNRTYYTHRIPRRPTVTVPEVMHAAVTAGEAAAAPPPPGAALKVPNRKLSNVFPLFGNALGNVARTATRSMLGDLRQLGLQGEVGMDTKAPGEPQDAAAAGRGPGAGPELQKCSSVARKATALNMIEAAHAELADVTQKARAHRASTPSGGSFSAGSGSASCVGRRANSFCFAAANGAAANGGLPVQALSGVMEGDGEAYAVARDIASHAIEERDKAKAEHAAAASRRTTTIGSGRCVRMSALPLPHDTPCVRNWPASAVILVTAELSLRKTACILVKSDEGYRAVPSFTFAAAPPAPTTMAPPSCSSTAWWACSRTWTSSRRWWPSAGP